MRSEPAAWRPSFERLEEGEMRVGRGIEGAHGREAPRAGTPHPGRGGPLPRLSRDRGALARARLPHVRADASILRLRGHAAAAATPPRWEDAGLRVGLYPQDAP